MWITDLILQDFRNYSYEKVSFSPHLNVILGNNGEGKTNLLEAIHVLSTTRSHRTNVDRDMVMFGEKFYYLSCMLQKKTDTHGLEMGYSLDKKYKLAKVSGVNLTRISDIIGVLNVVLFSPEDLSLVNGSPTYRRRFIDILLSQLDRKYLADLQSYQKILAQRNDCLKLIYAKKFNVDVLDMWDEQFSKMAIRLRDTRCEAFGKIKPLYKEYAGRISSRDNLTIGYLDTLSGLDEIRLLKRLSSSRLRDIQRGTTSYGPHRDDVLFFIDGRPAAQYASQGQQRTAVLALKLTELEYMKSRTGESPVLLLDDVFSELDDQRRSALVKVLSGNVQCLLTGTKDTEFSVLNAPQGVKMLNVEQGRVI